MQLFVTEYQKKGTIVDIGNVELLSQIRKVLRANIGDTFWIQSPENENKKTRYELRIDRWDNKTLQGTIISEQTHESIHEKKSMIIAMPNKWDKVELIVQKLTECGLDQIVFWPSERSVIKEWNPKKEERLHKIIKEAVEQSRGWTIPELRFASDITKYIHQHELIVFDTTDIKNDNKETITTDNKAGLVGPEGGLTTRDYKILEAYTPKIVSLGTTVLRTETAAIIGGRIIKNNK